MAKLLEKDPSLSYETDRLWGQIIDKRCVCFVFYLKSLYFRGMFFHCAMNKMNFLLLSFQILKLESNITPKFSFSNHRQTCEQIGIILKKTLP